MIALDLFAGTGWGVACQRLGIEEYGVEIMPEARAVRAANGMRTIYADVWEGLEGDGASVDPDLLIASPPCQTFSMAGGGSGRRALDEVLGLIRDRAYFDPAKLRAFGEAHDPRTALVLTPLAHIVRDAPTYVVLEQVPPVLPVWEAYAEEMRRWGYSVWTGNLQAEMYGVPQTRKRAILIARADGIEAKAPRPTHSRYYSRDPQRLDEGVLPWVSMAEALGWGMSARPMVTAGNAIGRAEGIGGSGGKAAVQRQKDAGEWIGRRMAGAGPAAERTAGQIPRDDAEPAHTITGKGTASWLEGERPAPTVTAGGTATGGAEVFGRYGRDIVSRMRSNYGTNGDASVRGERAGVEPAPTVTSKVDRNKWEAAGAAVERVSVAEAAILQSYPADFIWDVSLPDAAGRVKPITKTKQFLQIGNAVPPRLAEAVLREIIDPT